MTIKDSVAFSQLLNRLAILRPIGAKALTDEERQGYFAALMPLDLAHLEAAVPALLRSERYFPRPAQWFDAAQAAKHQALAARPRVVSDPGHQGGFVCARCKDVGWLFHECQGTAKGCARPPEGHGPRRWATKCVCFEHNRVVQQKNAGPNRAIQENVP